MVVARVCAGADTPWSAAGHQGQVCVTHGCRGLGNGIHQSFHEPPPPFSRVPCPTAPPPPRSWLVLLPPALVPVIAPWQAVLHASGVFGRQRTATEWEVRAGGCDAGQSLTHVPLRRSHRKAPIPMAY